MFPKIYHHDLDPFLFGPWQVGSLDNIGVRWYSLPYILGFLAIYLALRRAVVARQIPNGNLDRLEEAALLLILSVIVGGRLGFFILNEPHRLLTVEGWLEVPQVWHGGMAFFGAAAAIYFAEVWYCRKHHLGFWHGADQVMWIFAFALGFGRIANFINGELYGNPTDGSWGVIFNLPPSEWVNGVNVPRHPVQLYSAVSHFILGFWILWKLRSKPRTEFDRIPGFTVFHFLAGYGILRFITDYWRHESIWIIPSVLHGGQLLSLALVVIAVVGARVRYRRAVSRGSVTDFYPPDGAMAPLPPECHAYLRAEEERARRDAPDASVRPDGKGGGQTRSKSHGSRPKKAKKPKR